MRRIRAFALRTVGLFLRRGRDRELAEELEAHLQMHIDDNIRLGMDPAQARRHALIKLGGLDQTKEAMRDRAGLPPFESILKDVRFAVRLMRRTPAVTGIVMATLMLAIAANTVMFSVVNTVLLRPLPYDESERLMLVRPVQGGDRSPSYAAPPDFYRYRRENGTFDWLEAFYSQGVNLTGELEPERVTALVVSSGFFSCLRVPPAIGRAFTAADEEWGNHRVVLLSDQLWQRRFGADRTLVGRAVMVNGEPRQVVGILPPGFSFLNVDAQLVLPMAFERGDNLNSHNNYFLRMIGRLKDEVSAEQAAAELDRITEAIAAEFSINEGTAISVRPLQETLVGNVRLPVLVLLGAVGFVLLIACANLANLMLARALSRRRETAVRLALGATRSRLLRQFLIESVLLSFTAGAIGLGVTYLAVDALNLISRQVLPRAEDIRLDAMVLLFTVAVATVTGVVLGVVSGAYVTNADLAEGVKDTSRTGSESGGRLRIRGAMVAAEVALSLVLLVGSGLMIKSLVQLLNVPSGFNADSVLTLQINLPPQKYVDAQLERRLDPRAYTRANAFFDEIVQRIRTIRGADAVGAINGLPLMGEIWGKNATLFDRPLPPDLRGLAPIQYRVVAGDYFRALGVRILSGRAFDDRDTQQAAKVAIINREMARRHWANGDPLGKVISVNPPRELLPASVLEEARRAGTLPDDYEPTKHTIVGVADDVRYGELTAAAVPLVYVPYSQGSEGTTNMFVVVRSTGDPRSLVTAIRTHVAEIDPDQPIAAIQTMNARVAASTARPRLQTNVLAAFAAVAILLAAVGIYGVMSYAVTQRAKEIGIRLALGATRREVIAMVLRQGFGMVGLGVVIGIAAALALGQFLRRLLFEVSAADPVVFTTIVMLLAATALAAAYLPARRAARLNPVATLRTD